MLGDPNERLSYETMYNHTSASDPYHRSDRTVEAEVLEEVTFREEDKSFD